MAKNQKSYTPEFKQWICIMLEELRIHNWNVNMA